MDSIDIDKVRSDTPGLANVIHFGSAGASLMPSCVVEAMVGHIQLEAAIGGYEAATEAGNELDKIYSKVGKLLSCDPAEVALTDNATTAWQKAFYSINFSKGDVILTSQAEYSSNYISFLQIAKNTGACVEVIPNDTHHQLDVDALRKILEAHRDREAGTITGLIKLIAISHVPTNSGLVQPAAAVGALADEFQVM